ncbi:ervatamin-B-like [Cicer arietinum]|uniref:Ervatamin-B-like n=1 Tax=Cicer arietinum TaxID=3827 RepID=A0A1S2XI68_CICAR|nr:ervatamin-B-like [Cicer arietinum]
MAAVEGIVRISGSPLKSLSQQELVDSDDVNHGCENGKLSAAFKYIIRNKGLVEGEVYPYKAVNGTCRSSGFVHQSPISDYYRVVPTESYLQPTAIAVAEVIVRISGRPLKSLSQQELVDCDDVNHGCENGKLNAAFKHIIRNKGLVGVEVYPYEAVKGTCRSSGFVHQSPISDYYRVVPTEAVQGFTL